MHFRGSLAMDVWNKEIQARFRALPPPTCRHCSKATCDCGAAERVTAIDAAAALLPVLEESDYRQNRPDYQNALADAREFGRARDLRELGQRARSAREVAVFRKDSASAEAFDALAQACNHAADRLP